MNNSVAKYRFEEMEEGRSCSISVSVSAEDIDRYSEISGDISPLHMDADFARDRGFRARVVHGTLLASYVSRIIGVHFPGENALIHSIDLKFLKPVCAGATVRITAVVDQVSPAAKVVILKISVEDADAGVIHARGKAQVGFTESLRKA